MSIDGRVMPASNATFVGTLNGIRIVYKPIAGERPLWDFPDGCLAWREVAAWHVSEALDWNIVPYTLLGSGPHGEGMVQEWQEPDPDQAAVDIVGFGETPAGYCHVFDGVDHRDRPVSLIDEDDAGLRRMAIFDVLINNGDRKGGHVLAMPDGHRYGVDHGVSFHTDNKLRTVLWGWSARQLSEDELRAVHGITEANAPELRESITTLLTEYEIDRFYARIDRLLAKGRMPEPSRGVAGHPVAPLLSAGF